MLPIVPPPGLAKPSRSPLSRSARSWAPIAESCLTDPDPDMMAQADAFHQKIVSAIERVVAALQRVKFCMNADVSWHRMPGGPSGCTLTATIGLENVRFTAQLVTEAKKAIFRATWEEADVFLLGTRQRPFTLTSQGFVASLGSRSMSGRSPCPQVYNSGFCRYGEKCKFAHPAFTMPVHFLVAITGPQLDVNLPCAQYQ